MTELSDQECDFVTLARAARIVAPIAELHQQSHFEGGVFLIWKMLAESPIGTRAANPVPDLPELRRLGVARLTQGWFAKIADIHWSNTFDKLKREERYPARAFLNWANANLLVSRTDVVENLHPPFSPGHEPVSHCNAAGAWWSFPQILAWAATRDVVEVARIGSADHFGSPIPSASVPVGMTTDPSDRGFGVGAPTNGDQFPHDTVLQSADGRRKLVGWLAMVTALRHCRCNAQPSAEKEKWESCSCLGNAYDEVRRFGPLAAQPIPKYQPQPEYGSFSLEWSDESHSVGAYRSDVLKAWPKEDTERLLRSSTSNRRAGRPKGSGSMAAFDAPLVEEMQQILDQGKATSASAAAAMVVEKATGHSTESSKIARLVKRFNQSERK